MLEKKHLEKTFDRAFLTAQDNYKACCPFHDERTPSFFVHKDELIANCFGCGISGSIDFLASQYLSVSLEKARENLEIDMGERLSRSLHDGPKKNEYDKREARYYPESWLAPWKKGVHNYVLSRGFKFDTIRAAGARYDPTTKRQVFPHRDREGRLLGAAGRSCSGAEPKWYFYWEYNKGQALFLPRWGVGEKNLILVEGIFDALWLYQNGITNVAAILGSKATSAQLQEIKDGNSRVIIGLDNDTAGREGSERLHRGLRQSLRTEFVAWPGGKKDWMDLSKEEIETVLDSTQTYVQWKTL